ncbi:akirin-1 isoform X1 [Camelus ferus]|uniref:Akirin-1 isoform X1 n=1 Tax=Camelus ferus TaxID=419612 RepID=A0A8B8U6H3_CAMFR|nr:akirin-1 isoform X1 [Camelus ferus]
MPAPLASEAAPLFPFPVLAAIRLLSGRLGFGNSGLGSRWGQRWTWRQGVGPAEPWGSWTEPTEEGLPTPRVGGPVSAGTSGAVATCLSWLLSQPTRATLDLQWLEDCLESYVSTPIFYVWSLLVLWPAQCGLRRGDTALGNIPGVLAASNKSFLLPLSGMVMSIGSTPSKRQTQFSGIIIHPSGSLTLSVPSPLLSSSVLSHHSLVRA